MSRRTSYKSKVSPECVLHSVFKSLFAGKNFQTKQALKLYWPWPGHVTLGGRNKQWFLQILKLQLWYDISSLNVSVLIANICVILIKKNFQTPKLTTNIKVVCFKTNDVSPNAVWKYKYSNCDKDYAIYSFKKREHSTCYWC